MLFPMPSFSSPKQGGRQKTEEAWGWREGDKERKEEKEKKWRAERRRGGGKEEEGTTGEGMERKRCHACTQRSSLGLEAQEHRPRARRPQQAPLRVQTQKASHSLRWRWVWNWGECVKLCPCPSLIFYFFLLFYIFWLPNSIFFNSLK